MRLRILRSWACHRRCSSQASLSQAIPMSVILDEIVVGVESGLGAGDRVDETPGVGRIAWSRAACAVPDLAARRASPPGALGRSARLRSRLLVGDRGEDALVADGAAHRVVAAGSGVGSSPSGMGGPGRCCTFDRSRLSENPRNHAETSRRSTPVKSSHVQSGPFCTWEPIH